MRVAVRVPDCRGALRRLAHPVERRSGVGIHGVRIQVAGEELTLSTTDGDVFAWHRIPCETSAAGSAVCNYWVLRRLLEAADGERLDLESGVVEHALVARVGHAEATLPFLSDEPWRGQSPLAGPQTSFDAETLDHIRRLQASAARDMSRPSLCGVHFGSAAVVATDGHRICVLEHAYAGPPLTVPRETLSAVLNSLSGGAYIWSDGIRAQFSSDVMDWTTPLIELPFPDYERILPDYDSKPSEMLTEGLIGALSRMEAVVGPTGSATLDPVSPVKMEIRADGAEIGSITESLAVDGQLARSATFRVSYLIDALKSMDSPRLRAWIGATSGPLDLRGQKVRHVLSPQSIR